MPPKSNNNNENNKAGSSTQKKRRKKIKNNSNTFKHSFFFVCEQTGALDELHSRFSILEAFGSFVEEVKKKNLLDFLSKGKFLRRKRRKNGTQSIINHQVLGIGEFNEF